MFNHESQNADSKGEFSLYQKYFDICDVEDDESIYKKQLYILEDEKFTKKDESTLTLKHKSLLNRLILEDYSVYPLKKSQNEIIEENFKAEENKETNQNKDQNNNINNHIKEKGTRKSIMRKDNKKMDELEKFAEDENEFIKDLHRINYMTFSPFSLSFFNKEDINENYKGQERSEKLMKEKEKENKLFQMINFDYNKYEFNDELLLNICHGFVDVDKLKEENCTNPFGIKGNPIVEGTNQPQKTDENNEKSESRSGSFSENESEYDSSSEEEEKEEEKEEPKETEEKKEEKKDDILVSELIDEINKFIKEREDIEFYEEYFEEYNDAKEKMNQNMKITDAEEKAFYREWLEKFKDIEILYKKYEKERERLETIKKEKIRRELKELENIKLKKKEEDEKFVNELKKIRKKTMERIEEEKKEKIYFMSNDIEINKNKNKGKRNTVISPKNENKEIKVVNKTKKSQTMRIKKEKKKDRFDWMVSKKDNFFNDL